MGWRDVLIRHVRLGRHRPLLDRPDRVTGHAIKRVDEALFADLYQRLDITAIHSNVHQVRRSWKIVIPQAVVYGLEVPNPLPGFHLNRNNRLRKQVVTRPVRTVVVIGHRAGRQVDMTQLVIARQKRPHVAVPGITPRLVQPGIRPEFVRAVGHSVKIPRVLAGSNIPRAYPPRYRFLRDSPIGNLRAVDHPVADDDRRRMNPVEQRVQVIAILAYRAGQPDHRIDHTAAIRAEIRTGLPSLRLHTHQIAVSSTPKDALIVLTVGPIRNSPLNEGSAHRRGALFVALGIKYPQGLAGRRVDGDPLRERGVEIHDTADHERRHPHTTGPRQVPRPV